MSQRGSLLHGAQDKSSILRWTHIRCVLFISLALFLGTTLTLIAQDAQPPKTVTLCVDGTVRQVETLKETVQTVLHQEGICLNTHDRIEPPVTATVESGMIIVITRVTCEKVVKRIEVPAPTVTRWDARLSSDPVVLRQGKPGVAMETSIVWKKEGVVSVQWVSSTRVVQQPKPTVILRGNLPSRGGMRVKRVMTAVATAYDPGPLSCGPNATGRTATGVRATKGIIAVDPRVIPLGTRVFVDGYGPAVAADTGGAIKGNRIDVCFDSRRDALNWGRRTVQVLIYE